MSSFENINENYCSQTDLLLKQFRNNLSDIITPDVTDRELLKWLRAKNFNLRKCEEIYRIDYKMRAVFKVNEIETYWKTPEVIEKFEFANHIGFAKDDTPVFYVAMGRGDLKGFIMSLDLYDIAKYSAKTIETNRRRCREQSIKLGKQIDEVTYIVDMEHFALRQVLFSGVVESGLDLLGLLQDHYPEIWKNVLIVNAPVYFQTIFNLFKPIFRHTFLEKVHVVSSDRTASLLLKFIDAEVLPAFLGGKRVDSMGDPMCSEFMKFGGIVPEKYFLRNRTPLMPTDPGVEDVWIPPKCVHNIIVVVPEANSKITVEIRTERGSLPVALYYGEFGPNPDHPVLPGKSEFLDRHSSMKRVGPYVHFQTHITPVDNYCFAPWSGIYVFHLDNSFNWLTYRRCIYRFRAVPPSEQSNIIT